MPWDWIISTVGVLGFILTGRRIWWGWWINVVNQISWVIFAITIHQYGLLFGVLVYTPVFLMNAIKWTKERHPKTLAEVWDEAYWLGVHDEELSQDWTSGQVSPARQNPYGKTLPDPRNPGVSLEGQRVPRRIHVRRDRTSRS